MQHPLPLGDDLFPLASPELQGMTTCDECGDVIPLTDDAAARTGRAPALVVTKKTAHQELVFHFCDETHANQFYLERLRKEGL